MINNADIIFSGFRNDLKKKKEVKFFSVQLANFTRKWLIAVFALIQTSLIILICTLV